MSAFAVGSVQRVVGEDGVGVGRPQGGCKMSLGHVDKRLRRGLVRQDVFQHPVRIRLSTTARPCSQAIQRPPRSRVPA